MLYFVPMNFVLKQPSNIAQMRAQNEGAYDGYILCYMQKKEKKVLRYAPYHAPLGCKRKNLVCSSSVEVLGNFRRLHFFLALMSHTT